LVRWLCAGSSPSSPRIAPTGPAIHDDPDRIAAYAKPGRGTGTTRKTLPDARRPRCLRQSEHLFPPSTRRNLPGPPACLIFLLPH